MNKNLKKNRKDVNKTKLSTSILKNNNNDDNKDDNKKKLCPERLITCLKKRIKLIAKQHVRSKQSSKDINQNIDIPDEENNDITITLSKTNTKRMSTLKIHNRIQELAYPQVRKLMETKKQYKKLLRNKVEIFDKLLNESQSSYYSRLANIKPIEKPQKPPKWTEQEWKKHKRIAKKMAQPKKIVLPPPVEKVVKPIKEFEESIEKLSRPKRLAEDDKPVIKIWEFSDSLKNYKASERIIELGKPVDRQVAGNYKDPTKIEPAALSYTATQRIVELAKTKKINDYNKPNPFVIPSKVLNAKATKRIIELAKPKDTAPNLRKKIKKVKKQNSTNVSKSALMAIPTNRILELSKPRDQY